MLRVFELQDTVSVAVPVQRDLVTPILAGAAPVIVPEAVVEEFEPIAIGPAIVDAFEPIAVGPAIVDAVYEPISVGPAIIDFPLPDGGAVTAVDPSPVAVPSPVVIGDSTTSAGSPLVQIIVNVNQAQSAGVNPAPVADAAAPEPITVVETAPPTPIQVVETAPVAVEPVIIGTPIIPEPAVTLPEQLN